MPVPHQIERERQQRLRPGHAGRGVGEGQALVLRPARIMAGRDDVDRSVRDRRDARLAIILRPERGRQAGEGAEIGHRIVGQEQIGGADAATDPQPFRLGRANEVEASPGRHQPEMDRRACLPRQHDVPRDRHGFGAGGRVRQAQSRRRLTARRHRLARQPAILGMGDHRQPQPGRIG